MSASGVLYVGMGPPNTVRIDVTKTAEDLDFVPADVTSATIEVTMSDRTTASWAATVSNVTSAGLRASHTLATSDVTTAGVIRAWVKMNVPGGWVRSESVTILALNPGE